MSNQMSDDRFDDWVKDAARDYNRPPDIVPRDAMWDAIQARKQEQPLALDARHSRFSASSWRGRPWTLAAAAVLLLAAGIGIGRLTLGGRGQEIAQRSASQGTPTTGFNPSPTESTQSAAPGARDVASRPTDTSVAGAEGNDSARASTGYDVMTTQHLTSAEVLLTTFRAESDTALDETMRQLARRLLSTTRLLLDSPAGRNPQRRGLLEDLELVLIQMVQLPSRDATLERELIDRSIARRQVLIRIRTSIPRGFTSGT